nr:unnamed protein product [Digitaria exilis]
MYEDALECREGVSHAAAPIRDTASIRQKKQHDRSVQVEEAQRTRKKLIEEEVKQQETWDVAGKLAGTVAVRRLKRTNSIREEGERRGMVIPY